MRDPKVVRAALAIGATFGTALPFLPLFAPGTWLRSVLGVLLVIGLAGIGLRRLTSGAALIGTGQAVAGLYAALLLNLRDTLFYGLPTWGTLEALMSSVTSFTTAISQQAAPVETTAEITLVLTLIFWLLGLSVDLLGVTKRMPAAAGLPLLTAYVAAASNSNVGLGVRYFLLPAAAWIALVAHEGAARLLRWGSVVARPRGGVARNPAPAILTWARGIAIATIAAAVLVPGMLPHLPPRFLADGLARGDRGGNGAGTTLSDTLAVAESLGDRSTEEVLRYETDDTNPPPLRVDVLSVYTDGVWRSSTSQLLDSGGQLPGTEAGPDIARRTPTATFTENLLAAPQLALPGTAVSIDAPAENLRVTPDGILKRLGALDRYTVSYEEPEPSQAQLRESDPRGSGAADELALDERSADYVGRVVDRIAPANLTAAEQAWRIQAYLRSAQFTYSLDLATPVAFDDEGTPMSLDPLSQFLATRRGYCVQFATAMTMMARHRGIPARVAIGFLPGAPTNNGYSVRSADAHAWPELYFPDIGWVRFEPTPGIRTSAAPGWSVDAAPSTSASSSAPTTSASGSAEASESAGPTQSDGTGGAFGWIGTAATWLRDHWLPVGIALGAVLALLATPLAAAWRRRLALRRARDEAERVEVIWQSMLDRLSDVDVHPSAGDTPRQAKVTLARDAHLDPESTEALGAVVATLERARYAAPGSAVDDVTDASELVAHTALSRRRLTLRLRARLWPREGRRAWSELGAALARGGRRQSR